MSNKAVLISKDILTNIADVIREKEGTTDLITPADMPEKVENMSGGGADPVWRANDVLYFDNNIQSMYNLEGGRIVEIMVKPVFTGIWLSFRTLGTEDIHYDLTKPGFLVEHSYDNQFSFVDKQGTIKFTIPVVESTIMNDSVYFVMGRETPPALFNQFKEETIDKFKNNLLWVDISLINKVSADTGRDFYEVWDEAFPEYTFEFVDLYGEVLFTVSSEDMKVNVFNPS